MQTHEFGFGYQHNIISRSESRQLNLKHITLSNEIIDSNVLPITDVLLVQVLIQQTGIEPAEHLKVGGMKAGITGSPGHCNNSSRLNLCEGQYRGDYLPRLGEVCPVTIGLSSVPKVEVAMEIAVRRVAVVSITIPPQIPDLAHITAA